MLHTRICDTLGIRHPILLAGMGRASTPELAAAVLIGPHWVVRGECY